MDITAIAIVAIVFAAVFGTPVLMLYLIIRACRSGGSKRSGETEAEETRLIQEIHHGLVKMERRVESLETLLLDEDRTKRARFDRELSEE